MSIFFPLTVTAVPPLPPEFFIHLSIPFIMMFGLLLAVFLLILITSKLVGGLTVTIHEEVYEGIGGLREEYVERLAREARIRGVDVRLTREDIVFEDLFLKGVVYISEEGPDLRYGFRIDVKSSAIAIMVILGLLSFFVVGVIVALICYIKYSSTKQALIAAGEAAASYISRTRQT